MATTAAKKPKQTVGSLIDKLHGIREKKRALAVEEKKLSEEYSAAEQDLIQLMDAEGVTKSTGKSASASLSESQQFNVADWEQFMPYVAKMKRWDLVQKRVSAPSVRELVGMKGVVPPGLEQYTKREIGLRNL